MFTGIIETTGVIKEVISNDSNKVFWIESPLSAGLRIDQSLSHSGVCLTIEETRGDQHRVTAIEETIQKTTIGNWQAGMLINLERCLPLNGRLDGHLVQGHTDVQGVCIKQKEKNGSREFQFEFPRKFSSLLIEKGSICVNGISLTAFDVRSRTFRVAIIPYTYEHTNLREVRPGDQVNLEFDMVGKYINRLYKKL